jgi:hypothetical protein
MNELQLVALMANKAKQEGVLAEVVLAFGKYMERGDGVVAAATCALFDHEIELAV